MSLSIISTEKRAIEEGIQKTIFASIDESKNIIFSAGAGAGKTYALIKSLKYIIKEYGSKLKQHNQKVICITYTYDGNAHFHCVNNGISVRTGIYYQ